MLSFDTLASALVDHLQTTLNLTFVIPSLAFRSLLVVIMLCSLFLAVPGNGMSACDSGGGYNKMSTAGFGSNPHPGSTGEPPPLLSLLLLLLHRSVTNTN